MTDDIKAEIKIRASGLPSYADCSRRAATRLVWDEIINAGYDLRSDTTSNVGAALGSSTHEAAAYSLNTKMYDGTLGSESDAFELAIGKFEEIRDKEGVTYDATTPTYDKAELQLRTLVNAYRTQVAPEIKPVEVEIRLEADIGDGFILSGQFDVREAETLRDLKTGAVARANIAQYGAYVLLCWINNRTVKSIVEDYLPRKKEPIVEPYRYKVENAALAARSILKRIKEDINSFRKDGEPTSFISNPGSMLCSDRFCPAWGTKFCCEHKPKSQGE